MNMVQSMALQYLVILLMKSHIIANYFMSIVGQLFCHLRVELRYFFPFIMVNHISINVHPAAHPLSVW